jgi:3-hydroxyacyl-[acyl-carrier protein] dehydratase/trans-2-decenoyl-[acyl-carrier protein] isomerase
MTYKEFMERTQFDVEDLIGFAYGRLVDDPPEFFDARLPAPPFLMVHRIPSIQKSSNQGLIIGEQDIRLDAWYFQCHMVGDPVQPGCLCVDAIWQLLGFFCVWRGGIGAGRALGCGEINFNGQIRPYNKVVRFEVDVKRFSQLKQSGASIAIGDGRILVDGDLIGEVKGAKVGIFQGIVYPDYPKHSPNSLGGMIKEVL